MKARLVDPIVINNLEVNVIFLVSLWCGTFFTAMTQRDGKLEVNQER